MDTLSEALGTVENQTHKAPALAEVGVWWGETRDASWISKAGVCREQAG